MQSGAAALVLGAMLAGLIGGAAWQWRGGVQSVEPESPSAAIEWTAVQAAPTRAADADDVAWEHRASAPSVIASRESVRQSRPDRFANARDDEARVPFGYCHRGGGTNCVVDGDTFRIGGEKVRIAGIDAPETHPPRCDHEAQLGDAATEKLRALLNSGAVTMTSIDRDRDVYGRLLRNVQVDGADVGEAMVNAGVAREWAGHREPWC